MVPATPTRVFATVSLAVAVAFVTLACGDIRTGDAEIHGVAKFKMPAFPETGANVIEIFNEMHYQPSYKSQEGPRILPPPDSVPVTGRELAYATLEEYDAVAMPGDVLQSYDAEAAAELYRVNCLVCHGPTMTGDGMMVEKGMMKRGPLPANLMSELTQESSFGELFAYISRGGRQGFAAVSSGLESGSPMPQFSLLLTEQERWSLAKYLLDQ